MRNRALDASLSLVIAVDTGVGLLIVHLGGLLLLLLVSLCRCVNADSHDQQLLFFKALSSELNLMLVIFSRLLEEQLLLWLVNRCFAISSLAG